MRVALDFLQENGIDVAKRGDMRHRERPSIRVSADTLQQAAARIARARMSSRAVRGTLLKLGFVASALSTFVIVPRLMKMFESNSPPREQRKRT